MRTPGTGRSCRSRLKTAKPAVIHLIPFPVRSYRMRTGTARRRSAASAGTASTCQRSGYERVVSSGFFPSAACCAGLFRIVANGCRFWVALQRCYANSQSRAKRSDESVAQRRPPPGQSSFFGLSIARDGTIQGQLHAKHYANSGRREHSRLAGSGIASLLTNFDY
jgi:hypothetical protein